MARTNRDKFFTGINQAYDALLTAIEVTEARGHRVSRAVLEEARKGEREVTTLARRWVDEPASLFENISAVFDVQARAQMRALELARDALQATGEYRDEVGEALRRFGKANSAMSKAAAEATREAYGRVTGRVLGEERGEERVPGGNGAAAGRVAKKLTAAG